MNSCFSYLKSNEPVAAGSTLKADGLFIRAARQGDLHGLASVLAESFHSQSGSLGWTYPILKLGIYEDLRTRLRSCSPHYLCLVAIATGTDSAKSEQIVGTVEMALRSDSWFDPDSAHLYISNLAVSESYRRQGIARRLLAGCDRTAMEWGFNDLYLHVLENNARARQLYHRCGYRLQQVESSLGTWLFQRPRRLFLHKYLKSTTS
ncbi:MAG: GNAT family N-acetyltransferase [Oscillatoria sp. PMC 1051.18]|nr:GNAT family N-acetyltransferase [Oscillatoria sp. PMC 1050.18]MEC5030448.1 GNAT family N-acetyltransferase [Oscillatoria sp. PMC 1051.18]